MARSRRTARRPTAISGLRFRKRSGCTASGQGPQPEARGEPSYAAAGESWSVCAVQVVQVSLRMEQGQVEVWVAAAGETPFGRTACVAAGPIYDHVERRRQHLNSYNEV
jgi:hypothetical protein